jgi:hypothetical protein
MMMLNVESPWFVVETYWDGEDEDWVGECMFNTLEEAKVWAETYEIGKPCRIVQCSVIYKGEVNVDNK